MDDFESLEEQLYLRRDIPDRKKFSKEEAFSAGMMPLSIIPNPCWDELKEYMMKKLRYTEEKADSSLAYLWFTAQTEENSMSIITSMISHKLSSMQELQEAIELFMDYVNHCPRWFLKGYSSEEAFVLFQKDKFRKNPPRIVAGPNMKAAGMDITPEMQARIDNLFRGMLPNTRSEGTILVPVEAGRSIKSVVAEIIKKRTIAEEYPAMRHIMNLEEQ